MRHTLLLLISLLLMLPAACTRPCPALDEARALMATHPDSALTLLRTIDPQKLNRHDRACHALYLVYTRNKQGNLIDSTFDSLLNKAEFAALSSPADRMLKHYFNGLRKYNDQKYSSAILEMLNAERIAKQIHDDLQLALIYRNIADDYTALHDHSSALDYSLLSFQKFKEANADRYIPYAVCNLAAFHNNLKEYDKALEYARQSLSLGYEKCDTPLIAESLSNIGVSYIAKKDYENALTTYRTFESSGIPYSCFDDIRNLGIAELYSGNITQAQNVVKTLNDCGADDYYLKYEIAKLQNDTAAALSNLEEQSIQDNDLIASIIWSDAGNVINEYYRNQEELSNTKLEKERILRISILATTLLAIILLVMLINQQKRKHMAREMENMLKINELNSTIAQITIARKSDTDTYESAVIEHKNKIAQLQEDIKILLSGQSKILNQLCNTYYESLGTTNEKTRIYNKAIELIKEMQNNGSIIKDIESTINNRLDNLILKFRTDFNNSKEDEVLLFIYIVIALKPRSMSVMLGVSTQIIYNRKLKLRHKIEKSDTPNRDIYLSYFQ